MKTLTQVRNNTWRINHPQTNAALTRSGGFASPDLYGRLLDAIGCTHINEQIGVQLTFRRGNNSRKWYFTQNPA